MRVCWLCMCWLCLRDARGAERRVDPLDEPPGAHFGVCDAPRLRAAHGLHRVAEPAQPVAPLRRHKVWSRGEELSYLDVKASERRAQLVQLAAHLVVNHLPALLGTSSAEPGSSPQADSQLSCLDLAIYAHRTGDEAQLACRELDGW